MNIQKVVYETEDKAEFDRWLRHLITRTILNRIAGAPSGDLYARVLRHMPVAEAHAMPPEPD